MNNLGHIANEIVTIQKSIDQAKSEKSKLEGTLETLNERLKEFKLDNIENARKEMDRLEAKLKKIEEQIVNKYNEISENYEW